MKLYRKVRPSCSEGTSTRAAAKHFGISRDNVKKMLSFSVPPGYNRTAVVKRPKLDGFTRLIDQSLLEDQGRNRKRRHTANRVFERQRDQHGFSGGYPPHQFCVKINAVISLTCSIDRRPRLNYVIFVSSLGMLLWTTTTTSAAESRLGDWRKSCAKRN